MSIDASRHEGSEDDKLREFGYAKEFDRVIGPFGSLAVSLSMTSICTGVFLSVGATLAIGGGAGVWVFLVNGVMMLFVGLVYATLAARIPVAGVEYQWGSRLATPTVGLAMGWGAFGMAAISSVAVNYVLASAIFPALFSYEGTTRTNLLVCAGVVVIQGCILSFSTRVTTMINNAVIVGELVIVVGLTAVLLVVGSLDGTLHWSNLTDRSVADLGAYLSVGGEDGVGAFWILLTVAFFSIANGFQGAANMAEETEDPSRVVPRAMIQTLLIGIVVQISFMATVVAAANDVAALAASPTTVSDILTDMLGATVNKAFLVVVAFNVFACGMIVLMQGARYVWSAARDGQTPGGARLARVNTRTDTPVNATLLVTLICLAILVFFARDAEAFTNLVGMSGLVAIANYLLVVVVFALFGRRIPVPAGYFSLGRLQVPVIVLATAWLLFCVSVFRDGFDTIWKSFAVFVLLGFVYVVATALATRPGTSAGSRADG